MFSKVAERKNGRGILSPLPRRFFECSVRTSAFPGGWQGDETDCFKPEGRTALQNEAYDFLSRIAHWRRGNDVIARGTLKHFIPDNGIYVYERSYEGKRVIVVMNGTDSELDVDMSIYREMMQPGQSFKDVVSGSEVTILPKMKFSPRAVYILE